MFRQFLQEFLVVKFFYIINGFEGIRHKDKSTAFFDKYWLSELQRIIVSVERPINIDYPIDDFDQDDIILVPGFCASFYNAGGLFIYFDEKDHTYQNNR